MLYVRQVYHVVGCEERCEEYANTSKLHTNRLIVIRSTEYSTLHSALCTLNSIRHGGLAEEILTDLKSFQNFASITKTG